MDLPQIATDPAALNPSQLLAVSAPTEPTMVLAGPGTGKTRVLTERIRHLVENCRIEPQHILALTFTNKAAEEMSARLGRALGADAASSITAGTFHRFCIGVLREHHEAAGLSRHFTIADDELQSAVLYRAVPRLSGEESNLTNALRHIQEIRRWKRRDPGSPLSPGDGELLRAYETELRRNHLVDFDELIFLACDLFRHRSNILDHYRDAYRHILVDEFQDTDWEQYQLVCTIAGIHRSLFIVADDEQSIYGWRNAEPENIRRFREDFLAGREPIILDQNYRSSEEVLGLARAFIANNEVLYDREVHAQKHGTAVRGFVFDSYLEEGGFIARDIGRRIAGNTDLTGGDFAVLYPQHAIGMELEKIFMDAGIPCQMAQRRGLFDQPALRRALSVLRYALNSDDDASLELFLRHELDAADPALYPAIRAVREEEGASGFKQAAFRYVQKASEEEGLEVERALGLAGVVTNAVQKDVDSPLVDLVDDILDQLNTTALPSLKNHMDDIVDPLDLSGMQDALEQVWPVCREGGTVYIAFRDEVLRSILTGLLQDALAGFPCAVSEMAPGKPVRLAAGAVVLAFDSEVPSSSGPFVHIGGVARQAGMGPGVVALKLCQALTCTDLPAYLPDYTAIDIETTDLDLDAAEIIEIGAVRVRNGKESDRYRTFVRPRGRISPSAEQTHGIRIEEVADAPPFEQVHPGLQEFVGTDVLVAHNGYGFDFQVLNRQARRSACPRLTNPTLDTLPMARTYVPSVRHNIDALCDRYGIPKHGTRHRALDDARFLHRAFEGLKAERASRYRRLAHERYLDQVALAMLFQESHSEDDRFTDEEDIHFNLGAQRLLAPGSVRLADLDRRFPRLSADKLRAQARMWLHERPLPEVLSAHVPDRIQRFRELAGAHGRESSSLQQAIRGFLDFADLYRTEIENPERNAINMLTLHAAKGLEFREVYICGLEDRILPGIRAVNAGDRREMEEQRRLLYVGMTRAMDRLTLTCAHRRPGRETTPSRFWAELQLELEHTPVEPSDPPN